MTTTKREPRARRAHAGIRSVALACALAVALGAPAAARAQATIEVPDVRGDQLLFFYDARASRTPFLLVSNPSDVPLMLDVSFYPASLASRLGGVTMLLPAAGHVVIDPTAAAGDFAVGNAGIAVVTPIAGAEDPTPVVPPVPLTGSFTLASTALGSAFGENAFGRLAVTGGGARAGTGSLVDGTRVRYQRIAPAVLNVPVYFAPASLGPVESDGNRVVVAAFSDVYAGGFSLAPATAALAAVFFDATGARIAERELSATGVLLSDLQSVAGPDRTLPSSGKLFLAVDAPAASVLGVFSQSLGTFASGHRMPAVPAVPQGTVGPTGCAQADVTATVGWDAAAFSDVSGVAVRIGYAPERVTLPGSGAAEEVRARVANLTGIGDGLLEAIDRPQPGSSVDDLASVALVSLSRPIVPGPFARVRFDCAGAIAPSASDLSCTTEAAALDGSAVTPASCALALQLLP